MKREQLVAPRYPQAWSGMIEDELAVMVSFFYYRMGFSTVDDKLADCHYNYGGSDADSSILSKLT